MNQIEGVVHGGEMRRILATGDVAGFMRLERELNPHLPERGPKNALLALHMARVEMKYISKKMKAYSIALLADHGIQKIDGRWVEGLPKPQIIAEVVGISVHSNYPRAKKWIHSAMEGALLNGMAKGVTEPLIQRELMQKARQKVRAKLAMV